MVGVPGVVFAPTEGLGLPGRGVRARLAAAGRALRRPAAAPRLVGDRRRGSRQPARPAAQPRPVRRGPADGAGGLRRGPAGRGEDQCGRSADRSGRARDRWWCGAAGRRGHPALGHGGHHRGRPDAALRARRRPPRDRSALHIAAGRDTVSPAAGHAEPIAAAAGGPVWLRTLRKAEHRPGSSTAATGATSCSRAVRTRRPGR